MAHQSLTGYDANGQRLVNVAAPTVSTDAVPQGYIAYDLGNLGQSGKPDAGVNWLDFVVVRKFTLAANLTGSVGQATTAPAADATFTLSRNGSAIATMKFAAGATVATFASVASPAAAITLAVGDRLQLSTPSTQDSALAGVSVTLFAQRAI